MDFQLMERFFAKSQEILAQLLKAFRAKHGCSQRELAQALKVSRSTVQKLEACKGNPCLTLLVSLYGLDAGLKETLDSFFKPAVFMKKTGLV